MCLSLATLDGSSSAASLFEGLPQPSEWSATTWCITLLLALLVFQTIRLRWVIARPRERLARHRDLGERGERMAQKLLRQAGYRVVRSQLSGKYELSIDGRATPIHLRADLLVEKQGRLFIAEVKAGSEAVKITGRATRRQLLEYYWAFDVDGLLLVDTHAAVVREVVFPAPRPNSR